MVYIVKSSLPRGEVFEVVAEDGFCKLQNLLKVEVARSCLLKVVKVKLWQKSVLKSEVTRECSAQKLFLYVKWSEVPQTPQNQIEQSPNLKIGIRYFWTQIGKY